MPPLRPRVLTAEEIPPSLRSLPRSCRRLYLCGALPPERIPKVAMVGSRTPSPGGERIAYAIARGLAAAGVVVVSGLARGIDAASHRGALDGGGVTVGFLGCGPDVVYPRSSRRLAEQIPERGALLSEYGPGAPPLPYRFVERNRLVAAYTLGTLVVEAGAKSGALITAGLAVELGRELWAVPGDPRRPSTRGSNRLLRDGAGVVLDAADLLAALGLAAVFGSPHPSVTPPPGLRGDRERVWRAVAECGASDLESLSRHTGLTAAALLEALSLLEVDGHIRRDREGYELADPRGAKKADLRGAKTADPRGAKKSEAAPGEPPRVQSEPGEGRDL